MASRAEEVFLRPLAEDDAAVSWRWRNDPSVWANTISRPDIAVTEEIERDWARKVLADPSRRNFAICLGGPSGRYIGNAYIVNIRGDVGSPSIFIGEGDCRGCGLGNRIMEALRREGAKLGLREFRAHVRAANSASLRMVFRNGGRILGDAVLDVAIPC